MVRSTVIRKEMGCYHRLESQHGHMDAKIIFSFQGGLHRLQNALSNVVKVSIPFNKLCLFSGGLLHRYWMCLMAT